MRRRPRIIQRPSPFVPGRLTLYIGEGYSLSYDPSRYSKAEAVERAVEGWWEFSRRAQSGDVMGHVRFRKVHAAYGEEVAAGLKLLRPD